MPRESKRRIYINYGTQKLLDFYCDIGLATYPSHFRRPFVFTYKTHEYFILPSKGDQVGGSSFKSHVERLWASFLLRCPFRHTPTDSLCELGQSSEFSGWPTSIFQSLDQGKNVEAVSIFPSCLPLKWFA